MVILAVGGWIPKELRAVFRRSTIADWTPRTMEAQEALNFIAKGNGGEILTLQIFISHFLKSPQWNMKLPVQRMRRMCRAFATLEEELRTMAEERKHFHLADEFFSPTEPKAFLNGGRASLLHNLVKASILDEGELENGVTGPKGLSDDEIIGNKFMYYLAGYDTTGSQRSK